MAQRLGLRRMNPDPELLALERLFLADQDLADAAVAAVRPEFWPTDGSGEELIDTLQAYFNAGENVAAAATPPPRNWAWAYRVEVESIVGRPLDAQYRRRLSAALLRVPTAQR